MSEQYTYKDVYDEISITGAIRISVLVLVPNFSILFKHESPEGGSPEALASCSTLISSTISRCPNERTLQAGVSNFEFAPCQFLDLPIFQPSETAQRILFIDTTNDIRTVAENWNTLGALCDLFRARPLNIEGRDCICEPCP